MNENIGDISEYLCYYRRVQLAPTMPCTMYQMPCDEPTLHRAVNLITVEGVLKGTLLITIYSRGNKVLYSARVADIAKIPEAAARLFQQADSTKLNLLADALSKLPVPSGPSYLPRAYCCRRLRDGALGSRSYDELRDRRSARRQLVRFL
jgi:hypothetical protein